MDRTSRQAIKCAAFHVFRTGNRRGRGFENAFRTRFRAAHRTSGCRGDPSGGGPGEHGAGRRDARHCRLVARDRRHLPQALEGRRDDADGRGAADQSGRPRHRPRDELLGRQPPRLSREQGVQRRPAGRDRPRPRQRRQAELQQCRCVQRAPRHAVGRGAGAQGGDHRVGELDGAARRRTPGAARRPAEPRAHPGPRRSRPAAQASRRHATRVMGAGRSLALLPHQRHRARQGVRAAAGGTSGALGERARLPRPLSQSRDLCRRDQIGGRHSGDRRNQRGSAQASLGRARGNAGAAFRGRAAPARGRGPRPAQRRARLYRPSRPHDESRTTPRRVSARRSRPAPTPPRPRPRAWKRSPRTQPTRQTPRRPARRTAATALQKARDAAAAQTDAAKKAADAAAEAEATASARQAAAASMQAAYETARRAAADQQQKVEAIHRSVAELQQKVDTAARQATEAQQKAEAARAAATSQQQKAEAASGTAFEQQRKFDATKADADGEQQKYLAPRPRPTARGRPATGSPPPPANSPTGSRPCKRAPTKQRHCSTAPPPRSGSFPRRARHPIR